MLPPGRCRDQRTARGWVHQLLAVSGFRCDRRECWMAILEQLVWAMDWETGLIAGRTHACIAAAAECSERTVSRTIAWAITQGLVLVAEQPASKEFLKASRGRTPTYALYRPPALQDGTQDRTQDGRQGDGLDTRVDGLDGATDRPGDVDDHAPASGPGEDHAAAPAIYTPATTDVPKGPAPTIRPDPQRTALSSTNKLVGDLPHSQEDIYPSHAQGTKSAHAPRGLNPSPDGQMSSHLDRSSTRVVRSQTRRRSLYVIPASPAEREQALDRVLHRAGIDPHGISRRTRWALRGLLRRWWDAGLAPAAVLHALGHHPDRPDRPHGPITTGARDVAAVAGARLRPWAGRLGELPSEVTWHHAAAVQAAFRATQPASAAPPRPAPPRPAEPAPATGVDDIADVADVADVAAAAPQTAPPDGPATGAALRRQLRNQFAADQARRRTDRAARNPVTGARGTHPGPRRPRT